MIERGAATRWVPCLLAALLATPGPVHAHQAPDHGNEVEVLREAAALERQGRPEAALRTLEELLAGTPTSSGALFALERVLRSLDRVRDVLPHTDRLLALDPEAAGPRYLKLRVLIEIDSIDALEPAARAWIEADPRSPKPYREAARLYGRALGPEAAIQMLERGLEGFEGDAGLSLDLGDVLATVDRPADAVAAWAVALRDPSSDVGGIVDRVRRLGVSGSAAVRPLTQALLREVVDGARVEGAVRIALEAGGDTAAVTVAERGRRALRQPVATTLLFDVAELAAGASAPELRRWALTHLVQDGRLERGSVERRTTLAALLRLDANGGRIEGLDQRLRDFRDEFPAAPEADDLAAVVARSLAGGGQGAAAMAVAGQVAGPRSQLERAWLHFENGDIAAGKTALRAALPGLAPARATEIIQLLTTLERVGPDAGTALSLAQAAVHRGRPGDARAGLADAVGRVPADDRPPLLLRAAELGLAQSDTVATESLLRRLVDDHATSPEAPEAMFTLARVRARRPEGIEEARALLRRLILERPQAAVVPAARRELERLGREG